MGLVVVIVRDGPKKCMVDTGDDEEETSLRRFCGLAAPMGVERQLEKKQRNNYTERESNPCRLLGRQA
jgi:hypothetical protein